MSYTILAIYMTVALGLGITTYIWPPPELKLAKELDPVKFVWFISVAAGAWPVVVLSEVFSLIDNFFKKGK